MTDPQTVYGIAASFDSQESILTAARRAKQQGYLFVEAYTPMPVEGLAEMLNHQRTPVAKLTAAGAICGAAGAYGMMWYASVISYPLNIGGKPTHSWPAFVPITFELTILCASLSAVFGMLALCKLPQLFHPLFRTAAFKRASRDRFVLCVESADPKFDLADCRALFRASGCKAVFEVPKR